MEFSIKLRVGGGISTEATFRTIYVFPFLWPAIIYVFPFQIVL